MEVIQCLLLEEDRCSENECSKESELFLDTKDTCFLCLQIGTCSVAVADEAGDYSNEMRKACFRVICRYLKIDTSDVLLRCLRKGKILREDEILAPNSERNRCDLSVRLCNSCNLLTEGVRDLISQIEILKILLDDKFQAFHRVILSSGNEGGADGDGPWRKLQDKMIACDNSIEALLVEHLRQETLEKCSTKLESLNSKRIPKVMLNHMVDDPNVIESTPVNDVTSALDTDTETTIIAVTSVENPDDVDLEVIEMSEGDGILTTNQDHTQEIIEEVTPNPAHDIVDDPNVIESTPNSNVVNEVTSTLDAETTIIVDTSVQNPDAVDLEVIEISEDENILIDDRDQTQEILVVINEEATPSPEPHDITEITHQQHYVQEIADDNEDTIIIHINDVEENQETHDPNHLHETLDSNHLHETLDSNHLHETLDSNHLHETHDATHLHEIPYSNHLHRIHDTTICNTNEIHDCTNTNEIHDANNINEIHDTDATTNINEIHDATDITEIHDITNTNEIHDATSNINEIHDPTNSNEIHDTTSINEIHDATNNTNESQVTTSINEVHDATSTNTNEIHDADANNVQTVSDRNRKSEETTDSNDSTDNSNSSLLRISNILKSNYKIFPPGNQYRCNICHLRVHLEENKIRQHLVNNHPECIFPSSKLPHIKEILYRDICKRVFLSEVEASLARAKTGLKTGLFQMGYLLCHLCSRKRTFPKGHEFRYHLALEHYDILFDKLAECQNEIRLDYGVGLSTSENSPTSSKKPKNPFNIVHNIWSCDVAKGGCGETFSSNIRLSKHLSDNRCPKNKKVIICNLKDGGCGKIYANEKTLKMHQQRSCFKRKKGALSKNINLKILSSYSLNDHPNEQSLSNDIPPTDQANEEMDITESEQQLMIEDNEMEVFDEVEVETVILESGFST